MSALREGFMKRMAWMRAALVDGSYVIRLYRSFGFRPAFASPRRQAR